jgi:hypothetical protein
MSVEVVLKYCCVQWSHFEGHTAVLSCVVRLSIEHRCYLPHHCHQLVSTFLFWENPSLQTDCDLCYHVSYFLTLWMLLTHAGLCDTLNTLRELEYPRTYTMR